MDGELIEVHLPRGGVEAPADEDVLVAQAAPAADPEDAPDGGVEAILGGIGGGQEGGGAGSVGEEAPAHLQRAAGLDRERVLEAALLGGVQRRGERAGPGDERVGIEAGGGERGEGDRGAVVADAQKVVGMGRRHLVDAAAAFGPRRQRGAAAQRPVGAAAGVGRRGGEERRERGRGGERRDRRRGEERRQRQQGARREAEARHKPCLRRRFGAGLNAG